MSSETPVLRRQPRRACKIRTAHGQAGAAGNSRPIFIKRKCKKAQPNPRQRQNENAEGKTSRMKTQKTHGKHLSSNQKETRDESKRTPIWKPIPQKKPPKRSTAKKRTYDANKKTQDASRSPDSKPKPHSKTKKRTSCEEVEPPESASASIRSQKKPPKRSTAKKRTYDANKKTQNASRSAASKPKPQSKAKKRPPVKKWSHKNPPPLPSDWSDWAPWQKEVWREQWRDPKERLEENIRLHKRAVKEAIERNRLRAARMAGSSSTGNGSGPSTTKQGFRSLFPHKVPNLKASLPEDVLGVEVSCTKKQAAKQFRRLSLVLHPDKNKDPRAKDWFTKVNDAYLKLKHQKNW